MLTQIVPVPELILQYEGENELIADPLIYSHLRDEVFFNDLSDFFINKGYGKNQTTSEKGWFFHVKDFQKKLDRFDKQRNQIVEHKGKYYLYKINKSDLEWNAIQLYQFETKLDCEKYLEPEDGQKSLTWFGRLLQWFK